MRASRPPGHRGLIPCTIAILLLASSSRAADTGTIAGTLTDTKSVKSVTAIHRESGKRTEASVDPKTGRFTITALPLDRPYDLIVDTAAARLEGVDMSVPRSDYEEEQPLSDEDAKAIAATTKSLNAFEDRVDVLAIRGNIQHAAVIVNKLRTRPFYNSKPGEVVWRAELWRYEKPDETWVKSQTDLFLVLYRERLQEAAYARKSITFDPTLGGLRPTADKPAIDLGRIAPPDPAPGVRFRGEPAAEKKPDPKQP